MPKTPLVNRIQTTSKGARRMEWLVQHAKAVIDQWARLELVWMALNENNTWDARLKVTNDQDEHVGYVLLPECNSIRSLLDGAAFAAQEIDKQFEREAADQATAALFAFEPPNRRRLTRDRLN